MTDSSSSYTIVFTDSGLGGLSIMADFYNIIKNKPININVLNIIFFNALQENSNGYNSMSSIQEKIETFNAALETILKLYKPDKIAIACNTLSAIYHQTPFAQKKHNTLEIISCGLSLIKMHLQSSEIPIFVLATPTTLYSQLYKIESKNVFYISGDNLASLIEFNYMMPELKKKVIDMFKEIKNYLKEQKDFTIFIGCTHYAYITKLFQEVSEELEINIKSIIDPAQRFNSLLINEIPSDSTLDPGTKINLRIDSQAQILNEEIESVSSMIIDKSPQLTELLKNYTLLPKTF